SLRRAKTGKSVFLTGTARIVKSFLSCAILNIGSCGERLFSSLGWRFKSEKIMSDNVTLFPNILQPAAALKAYAPLSVRFWENQDAALESLNEFADGWFARRRNSTQVPPQAAKQIGDAASPSDVFQEYQNWLTRAMELLA